nr:unnamed protein product [Callosobruchus chinensis]
MSSESFGISDGLRQGGVLSPTLFIMVMDDIIKAVKGKTKKVHIYRPCAFADDLLLCASTPNDLQGNLNIWNAELTARNLKVNVTKTKVMTTTKEKNIQITSEGKVIEQVEAFKYLGIVIQGDGTMEVEIKERLMKASKLYHTLRRSFICKKEISRKTKITVYKTIFRPVLTFGSESWLLSDRQKSKIQALEMKYLRGVKGVTRRDKIRNEVIRSEICTAKNRGKPAKVVRPPSTDGCDQTSENGMAGKRAEEER